MKPIKVATLSIVGFLAFYGCQSMPDSTKSSAPAGSPQAVVEENEIKMRWGCEDAIKAQLRDPKSYEAMSVTYVPSAFKEDPSQIVDTRIEFRSRNGFGGMAGGFARCGHNANGDIVRMPNVVAN